MKAKMLAQYDKLKALILLKKKEQGLSNQDIAAMIGVTRQTFGRLMADRMTDDWKLGTIVDVCLALSITEDELCEALDYGGRIE